VLVSVGFGVSVEVGSIVKVGKIFVGVDVLLSEIPVGFLVGVVGK